MRFIAIELRGREELLIGGDEKCELVMDEGTLWELRPNGGRGEGLMGMGTVGKPPPPPVLLWWWAAAALRQSAFIW